MSDLYVYRIRVDEDIERQKVILAYKENQNEVIEEFHKIVQQCAVGEQIRLYRSVNSRNEDKIREDLIIKIIKDKPSITKFNEIFISIAQQFETIN